MMHSYFILSSTRMSYPLYVAFNGYMTVSDMREHETAWTVIRHITQLDCDDYFIDTCLAKDFKNALVKIDFTFK